MISAFKKANKASLYMKFTYNYILLVEFTVH